jgi:hypothetical protein
MLDNVQYTYTGSAGKSAPVESDVVPDNVLVASNTPPVADSVVLPYHVTVPDTAPVPAIEH